MKIFRRRAQLYTIHFLRHDFVASIPVFFVALPLCLGIALASQAPASAGIIAGIVGGLLVSFLSKSALSVSGPAAGLTAISVAAINGSAGLPAFFLSVALAGIIQIAIGGFKLTGFTQFIPSAVIKGMLAAIGILLIIKQIPLLLGYDKADFWTKELFNILSFNNAFSHVENMLTHITPGTIIISLLSLFIIWITNRLKHPLLKWLPQSFIVVIFGILSAALLPKLFPALALQPSQFVHLSHEFLEEIKISLPFNMLDSAFVWKNALLIAVVASLETLLSIEAIDKLDPYNRITAQPREMMAQGVGNLTSGMLGGLPITAVIVRSAANAQAGARTKWSAFLHGVWLFVLVIFASRWLNQIPYCVLAIILIKTGINLAKPRLFKQVYKLGREQFLPFLVTIVAILVTDLLIGVLIGILYASYFIIRNTYKAGFTLSKETINHIDHYHFQMALNVSFLNKKKLRKELDAIPAWSVVRIDAQRSVYLDYDIIEIINEFKSKARHKHIELHLQGIPDVSTMEAH